MTWHADAGMLRGYVADELGAAHAASVEAHLAACATCRAELAPFVDQSRLERSWTAIADRLDERSMPLAERVLVRLGVRQHRARLVATMPALKNPSVLALVGLLAFVSLTNEFGGSNRDAGFYVFLVLAPLLPLAGVATAFGSFGDPARELASTTPTSAFELLLLRTLAIVGITTALTTAASLPLPHGWDAAAWLLPSLGLTAAALALSTWVPAHWAGIGLGGAWTLAAAFSWRVNRFDLDVASRFVALRPAGQLVFAALAVAGALTFVARRDTLDLRRFA